MKILLINPYLTTLLDDPANPSLSLSLGYLAAYLEKYYEVRILDIASEGKNTKQQINGKLRVGLTEEEIKKYLSDYGPHIVGITNPSTLHAQDAYDIARIVKEYNNDTLVVLGGAHSSSNPELVISNKDVDLVVIGEGEETLLDIARAYASGKGIDSISGTHVRCADGKIRIQEPREYIKDLDTIPFPARHLLPMDIYFENLRNSTNYLMRKKAATMITSRGCPGKCIYCAVKTVWGRRWRSRSAQNVVNEIEQIMRDFGVGEIHFLDDSISVNKKRLMAICDEIIKRKLDIKWTTPNGVAVWLLDKPLVKRMKEAGCYRLTFGLESGNAETLAYLGKKYNYEYAKEIIKYAHRIGLWTIGTFIIGSPEEKMESIDDTINFAVSSYLDFAVFYIANPFPGTEMFEIYKKERLLDDISLDEIVRGVGTKHFTQEELAGIQGKAFSSFLKSRMLKPWRGLTKIRSLEDVKYTINLASRFVHMGIGSLQFSKRGIAALWK